MWSSQPRTLASSTSPKCESWKDSCAKYSYTRPTESLQQHRQQAVFLFPFMEKETEAQRGSVTCPRLPSQEMTKRGLERREPSSLTCAHVPSLCHLPAGREASRGTLPVHVGCADTQQASWKRPSHAVSLNLSGCETHSVLGHKTGCVPRDRGNKEQPAFLLGGHSHRHSYGFLKSS